MNILFRRFVLPIAMTATLTAALPAFSAEADIKVVNPYVRMVPPGVLIASAFMLLKNTGDVDRTLLKVDSPIARDVELHQHIDDRGVMKMRTVDAIKIKAKGEFALTPGAYHMMLIGLNRTLNEGERVPLTLRFDDGSSKKVEARIERP
jgi:copper(I)-binding protein